MITLREITSGHGQLWQEYTPWLRNYVKQINEVERKKLWPAIKDTEDSVDRSINNQAAFILFSRRSSERKSTITECVKCAKMALINLPRSNIDEYKLRPSYRIIIDSMANRLTRFTEKRKYTVSPRFTGIGVLGDSSGDLLVEDTLIEVKAGARDIGAIDIKQLILYAALNIRSENRVVIKNIGIINPRMGYYWTRPWTELLSMVSDFPEEQLIDGMTKYLVQLGEGTTQ